MKKENGNSIYIFLAKQVMATTIDWRMYEKEMKDGVSTVHGRYKKGIERESWQRLATDTLLFHSIISLILSLLDDVSTSFFFKTRWPLTGQNYWPTIFVLLFPTMPFCTHKVSCLFTFLETIQFLRSHLVFFVCHSGVDGGIDKTLGYFHPMVSTSGLAN